MPIKRPLDQQVRGRVIGELRAGMQITTPDGKTRPTKLETIRFTTRMAIAAEGIASLFDSEAKPTKLANGQPTIEVITKVSNLDVIVPPGAAAIDQWREMWGGSVCKRRCDGEIETKTQSPCLCPIDHIERQALAAKGQACKDTTRLYVVLPDIPGLGVWKVVSNSYHAGVELGMTAEFLADLTAQGIPLPATLGIDPRTRVKEVNGKIQTTHFNVWTLDPKNTASEIAAIATNGQGMMDVLTAGSNLAIGAGSPKAIDCSSSAPAVEPQSDEELASPGQRKAIRDRLTLLSPIDKATFDRWIDNEKRAGGVHAFAQLRATEVEIVMAKLDVIDPKSAPPEWDDDEPIDAEIIEDAI